MTNISDYYTFPGSNKPPMLKQASLYDQMYQLYPPDSETYKSLDA